MKAIDSKKSCVDNIFWRKQPKSCRITYFKLNRVMNSPNSTGICICFHKIDEFISRNELTTCLWLPCIQKMNPFPSHFDPFSLSPNTTCWSLCSNVFLLSKLLSLSLLLSNSLLFTLIALTFFPYNAKDNPLLNSLSWVLVVVASGCVGLSQSFALLNIHRYALFLPPLSITCLSPFLTTDCCFSPLFPPALLYVFAPPCHTCCPCFPRDRRG